MMKSLYESGELVDVTLCVDSARFHCHRNVLAATSPYFRAMFTTALTERTQSEVELHEVEASAVERLINYAYSGVVEISLCCAQSLLAVASLFQVTPVMQACARFMEGQLDITNCVGIHYFAQAHSCMELADKAREHIEKNFVEVSAGEEWCGLSAGKLGELLASNELNVEKEEQVADALLRWLHHDVEAHRHDFPTLLKHIRFALLTPTYIRETIALELVVMESEECQQLLHEVRLFELNPENYNGSHVFCVILRSGMIKPEQCLLFLGGVDPTRPAINCYNPLTREAYYMADVGQSTRTNSGVDVEDPACCVTEDNQIFIAGGNTVFHEPCGESQSDDSYEDYDEETVRKELLLYDNDHDCWLRRAPMLFPKSNFAMVCVDGKLYCFGGLTLNQHPTEIVERYDISANRWSYVGMMPTTLVDLSAVVHQGMVYILGGRTGVGAHNVVMKFDPVRTEWTSLAGMPTPRFNFGACVVGGEIYVAGGQIYSHSSHTITREALHSVEIYSLEHNQWRQGPNLPEEVYNVGLALVSGTLYACGTTEYQRSAYRVYRYNVVYRLAPAATQWEQIEADLCDIRDFGCVAAKMHTRKLSQVFRPDVDT